LARLADGEVRTDEGQDVVASQVEKQSGEAVGVVGGGEQNVGIEKQSHASAATGFLQQPPALRRRDAILPQPLLDLLIRIHAERRDGGRPQYQRAVPLLGYQCRPGGNRQAVPQPLRQRHLAAIGDEQRLDRDCRVLAG
jgi:hypothetical protein